MKNLNQRIEGDGVSGGRSKHRARAAGASLAGGGTAAVAGAAVACCAPFVAPLVLASVGTTGAVWIAGMSGWAPFLLGVSLLLLLYGWSALRRAQGCKATTDSRPSPLRWADRAAPILLLFGAVVWLGSVGAYLSMLFSR